MTAGTSKSKQHGGFYRFNSIQENIYCVVFNWYTFVSLFRQENILSDLYGQVVFRNSFYLLILFFSSIWIIKTASVFRTKDEWVQCIIKQFINSNIKKITNANERSFI